MRSNQVVDMEQQAYIDRFCEPMQPPDSHAHKMDSDDDFERHFGNIEEIEHQVDLENLKQEEAELRAQKQAQKKEYMALVHAQQKQAWLRPQFHPKPNDAIYTSEDNDEQLHFQSNIKPLRMESPIMTGEPQIDGSNLSSLEAIPFRYGANHMLSRPTHDPVYAPKPREP